MTQYIDFADAAGVYALPKSWLPVGVHVQGQSTSKAAIQYAQLDFSVEKRPLFTTNVDPAKAEGSVIADVALFRHCACVRTDNNAVLGVVGKKYEIIQNEEAFAFFDSLVAQYGIHYETAGIIGEGERLFITAKMPDPMLVGKDDRIEKYLFLTTAHDGSGSITIAFTPIRIICGNTLNAALRNCTNVLKIRHTSNAKKRLDQANKVLDFSQKMTILMTDTFNAWTKVPITDKQVKQLIQRAMAPSRETLNHLLSGRDEKLSAQFKNVIDDAYRYAMSDPAQLVETTRGTLFGAYNAVSGYYQNVRKFKTDESKLKSIIFQGLAQKRSQSAFTLCEDFAVMGQDAFLLN